MPVVTASPDRPIQDPLRVALPTKVLGSTYGKHLRSFCELQSCFPDQLLGSYLRFAEPGRLPYLRRDPEFCCRLLAEGAELGAIG